MTRFRHLLPILIGITAIGEERASIPLDEPGSAFMLSATGQAGKPRARRAGGQVVSANRDALREPSRDAFLGAIQIYPYSEGTLYRLVASPQRVSDVALEPGETLVSVAAGDTARWSVGDTTSGAGELQRTHIMVKPQAAGLRTNLVITTDRRVYHLMLESVTASSMVAVRWSYPSDSVVAIRRPEGAQPSPGRAARTDDPTAFDFDYVIRGDKPAWRPRRAFDDGRQTFIELPRDLDRGAAPPFFIVGTDGRAELVNYRVSGHYYVVDRLFEVGELRLGENRQVKVRICKAGARHCTSKRTAK